MRRVFSYLIVAAMCLAMVGAANAAIQQKTPATEQQQSRTFQGTLVSVDASNHMLTVKGTDNKDMTFTYDDGTKITGPEKTIEGLAGKTGSRLTITYTANRDGSNAATQIEISD